MLLRARKCFTTDDPKVKPAPLRRSCQTDKSIGQTPIRTVAKWQTLPCQGLDQTRRGRPWVLREESLGTGQ